MKIYIWILLTLFALLIPTTYAAETPEQTKKDAEIINDIITIDKTEIAAANLALGKNVSKTVKNYALYLRKEHTGNLNAMQKLSQKIHINPAESDVSKDLLAEGEKEIDQLKDLDGKEFAKAYIDGMISDHKAALQLIDNDLLANSTNKNLKTLVEKTRIHVNAHLQQGLKIQSEMQQKD